MGRGLELLAPAGGMRELKAATASGADAVYMGASAFSARAGASNFTEAEMAAAVKYAHLHGVKVHCAINTLIKESELEKAEEIAKNAVRCGVDAIIIQDIGLARRLRKILPDTELHASTQMTVTSLEGVKYLESEGFSRVVLARELTFGEIRNIAKNSKAEIEVFVHGAICMCYSGQCLMSSILGGRSGNRGRCAQPCRLPYEITRNGKKCAEGYVLSPKDMSLIRHLPELESAGVASLKIEGRLKSAEYVSAVTGIYRKYLDNPCAVSKSDEEELRNAFSRSGFTDGYFTGRLGKTMMAHENPANNSGSTYTDAAKRRADGREEKKIPIDIYASLNEDDVLRLVGCTKDGICVTEKGTQKSQAAINKPLSEEKLTEQISKLGNTPFCVSSSSAEVENGITVPIKEVNETRRRLCEKLFEVLSYSEPGRILDIPIRHSQNSAERIPYLTAEVFTEEQGKAILESGYVKRLYAPAEVAAKLSEYGFETEIITRLSDIYTEEFVATEHVSVSSAAQIYKYKGRAKYGEWRLNIYNSQTAEAFKNLKCVTLSPELNLADIEAAVSHISGIETEIIAYGYLPLMLMKNCPLKAMGMCQNGKSVFKLRDRKNMEFPVVCTKNCRAVLLNSKPIYTADMTDRLSETGVNAIRLNFTLETPGECLKIAKSYSDAINGIKQLPMKDNTFTRGHFKRGV